MQWCYTTSKKKKKTEQMKEKIERNTEIRWSDGLLCQSNNFKNRLAPLRCARTQTYKNCDRATHPRTRSAANFSEVAHDDAVHAERPARSASRVIGISWLSEFRALAILRIMSAVFEVRSSLNGSVAVLTCILLKFQPEIFTIEPFRVNGHWSGGCLDEIKHNSWVFWWC